MTACKALLHGELDDTTGEPLDAQHFLKATGSIEAGRLEREGIQVQQLTTATLCVLFKRVHQLGADAG